MLRQMDSEPRLAILILKALGRGAVVLGLSVAAILVIFATLLAVLMGWRVGV